MLTTSINLTELGLLSTPTSCLVQKCLALTLGPFGNYGKFIPSSYQLYIKMRLYVILLMLIAILAMAIAWAEKMIRGAWEFKSLAIAIASAALLLFLLRY